MGTFIADLRPGILGDYTLTASSGRYDDYATAALAELLKLNPSIAGNPIFLNNSATVALNDPMHMLVRTRDRLSDSVKIFAALSIEGFLNLYGLVRFTDECFARFERLPAKEKTKVLLRYCHAARHPQTTAILHAVRSIMGARNAIVHPKSAMFPPSVQPSTFLGDKIPDVALQSVECLRTFYREFASLAPESVKFMHQSARTG